MFEKEIEFFKELSSGNFSGSRVLEVGCGDCEFMVTVLNTFPEIPSILGIDKTASKKLFPNESSTYNFRSRIEHHHLKGNDDLNIDTHKLSFEKTSIETFNRQELFDFIILKDVLHLEKDENKRLSMLMKTAKLLKPNAKVFIRVGNLRHGNVEYEYSKEKLERELYLSGLVLKDCSKNPKISCPEFIETESHYLVMAVYKPFFESNPQSYISPTTPPKNANVFKLE